MIRINLTCAVNGVVVSPKDIHMWFIPKCNLGNVWHNIREFLRGVLSNESGTVSSDGIEVAQGNYVPFLIIL